MGASTRPVGAERRSARVRLDEARRQAGCALPPDVLVSSGLGVLRLMDRDSYRGGEPFCPQWTRSGGCDGLGRIVPAPGHVVPAQVYSTNPSVDAVESDVVRR